MSLRMRGEIRDAEVLRGGVDGLEDAADQIETWLERKAPLGDTDTEQEYVLNLHLANTKNRLGSSIGGPYDYTFAQVDAVGQVIESLLEDAEKVAKNHTGKTRFAVVVSALNEEDTPKKPVQMFFTLSKPALDGRYAPYDEHDSEYEPTEAGFAGVMVKHTEISFREMNRLNQETNAVLREEIRELRAENKEHRDRHFQVSKEMSDLYDKRAMREMDFDKYKKEEERKDKTIKMLMGIAPVIAAKLLGGGQAAAAEMNGGRTPPEMMLEGLFESMSDDQKAQLVSIFNPVQAQTVMQIVQYFEERKKKEEEQKSDPMKIPVPSPSPTHSPFGAPRTP